MRMWEYRQCIYTSIQIVKSQFFIGNNAVLFNIYDLDMAYICHIIRRTKQLENLNKIWKGGDKW